MTVGVLRGMNDIEDAVLRKLVFKLADVDAEEVDVFEAANVLIERIEDMNERINELESIVDPDPTTNQRNLTMEQKVRRLRKALLRDARNNNGKSSMKYDEVRAIFDMQVSPGHAYNLMERAAKMDGFVYDQTGPNNNGQKRIRCKSDGVNDESLIQSVNKATSAEAA